MWNLLKSTGTLTGTERFDQMRLKTRDEEVEKHFMSAVAYGGGFMTVWPVSLPRVLRSLLECMAS